MCYSNFQTDTQSEDSMKGRLNVSSLVVPTSKPTKNCWVSAIAWNKYCKASSKFRLKIYLLPEGVVGTPVHHFVDFY